MISELGFVLLPQSAVDLICETRDGSMPGIRHKEPVTCGLPWPCGLILDTRQLNLANGLEKPRLLQARDVDRWRDGSGLWALLDWFAKILLGVFRVGVPSGKKLTVPASSFRAMCSQGSRHIFVDTGRAQFTMRTRANFPSTSVKVEKKQALQAVATCLVVTNAKEESFQPAITNLHLEKAGHVRALVRATGRLDAKGVNPLLSFGAELNFFVNCATVRIAITLTNARRAHYPGDTWTIGQKGSVYVCDSSSTLTLQEENRAIKFYCSPECGTVFELQTNPFEIYQTSSGGEDWSSYTHLNRHRQAPNTFRGYRLRTGEN